MTSIITTIGATVKLRLVWIILATFGLAAPAALLAQGCCGGGARKPGCTMGGTDGTAAAGGHEGHTPAPATTANENTVPKAALAQPVQVVFDNYIKVQTALAQDSVEGLQPAAGAMAKAIEGDSNRALPAKVAQQVDALAKAKDLETARAAFKPLSESLIRYLTDQKVPAGNYYEVYCPMAKASWLQRDQRILNPYLGKAMVHCGQLKT